MSLLYYITFIANFKEYDVNFIPFYSKFDIKFIHFASPERQLSKCTYLTDTLVFVRSIQFKVAK